MLASWLDWFRAVLDALLVHLEMTALVLWPAAGETFETPHNRLDGYHILAMVAHNLVIVGLHCWLVANCCVSCWMDTGDKTVERLEMTAVKEGNHTHAADDIHWRVSQIDWRCQWRVVNPYPRILNHRHGAVASQLAHPVEWYSLSLVEIPLSTCSVNKHGGKVI